ncbi:MAG: TIM barrel protein [Saccharofermentanales bacterium]
MKYYLFAKFFQHLTADALMECCEELGIDGPTAMIRDGYWVTRENQKTTLPSFIKTAQAHHLEVTYADTTISMSDIESCEEELRIMKDSGITQFRVNYISKSAAGSPRGLQDYTRALVEKTVQMAQKHNIQAIIQIHGYLYPHNATAAYSAVKGLDAKYIGIKIDPGNNICQEGYELFDYQIQLLGEYVAALGAKDGCVKRIDDVSNDQKGWSRGFAPAFEGISDYPLIFRNLKKINFNGPAILMPFYNEKNFGKLLENLKKEIKYFKDIESRT